MRATLHLVIDAFGRERAGEAGADSGAGESKWPGRRSSTAAIAARDDPDRDRQADDLPGRVSMWS